MANYKTGAQRYNDKMDKIWKEAKEAKKRTYQLACKISDHLLKTNQSFCFLESGEIMTKEQCEKIIDHYNTIK